MDPRNNPYHGASYDRYAQRAEHSTSHKLKNAYWTTKQAVIQKFGRKEDEHVVASDLELDSKLELFKSVQKTCADLICVIERYQEKICALSQAENEMGRFLKNRSSQDKTQAGKIMAAVGKSLSFSAQQRLMLRVPLTRLQQEVETFRYRAVSDTWITLQRMEASRTEYRGALLWMKDVSEVLDPDTFKQLEKFRKVQAQVRKAKSNFDKNKLDSMQKIDLLAASRCNMFSHVLSIYQDTLLQFWEKTSRTMVAVAESFRGYQYYEFSMLKDLAPESRKLAEITSKSGESDSAPGEGNSQLDELDRKLEEIFKADYKEETEEDIQAQSRMNFGERSAGGSGQALAGSSGMVPEEDTQMLSLDMDDDGRRFLEDLLSCGAPTNGGSSQDASGTSGLGLEEGSLAQQWDKVFGSSALGLPDTSGTTPAPMGVNMFGPPSSSASGIGGKETGSATAPPTDVYSALDDLMLEDSPLQIDWFGSMRTNQETGGFGEMGGSAGHRGAGKPLGAPLTFHGQGTASHFSLQDDGGMGGRQQHGSTPLSSSTSTGAPSKSQADMNRWVNLFADLDPLANPDQLSKQEGQITDA